MKKKKGNRGFFLLAKKSLLCYNKKVKINICKRREKDEIRM